MQTETEHVMQYATMANWVYHNPPRVSYDPFNQPSQNRPTLITGPPEIIQPKDAIKSDIRRQVEYYFSQDNLKNDKFLRENMDQDNYAPIQLVATFNKVKGMTTDIQLITEALKESLKLEVDSSNTKVRSVASHIIQIHSLIVRDLPQNYQLKNISDMLKQCNCPDPMEIEMALPGIWYIKYEEEDKSTQAFNILKNFTLNGQQLKVRAKTTTTTEWNRSSFGLNNTAPPQQQLEADLKYSSEYKYPTSSDSKFASDINKYNNQTDNKFMTMTTVVSNLDSGIIDAKSASPSVVSFQNTPTLSAQPPPTNVGYHLVNSLDQSGVLLAPSSGDVYQPAILPIVNRSVAPQIIKVQQVLPNTQIPPPQIAPPPIGQQIPVGAQMAVGYIPAPNYQFITPQGIIWPHQVMPVDSQMVIGPVDPMRLHLHDMNRVRPQEAMFAVNSNAIRYFESRQLGSMHPFLHPMHVAAPLHHPIVSAASSASEESRDARMRRDVVRPQTVASMTTNMYHQPYVFLSPLQPQSHILNQNVKPLLINEHSTTSTTNSETATITPPTTTTITTMASTNKIHPLTTTQETNNNNKLVDLGRGGYGVSGGSSIINSSLIEAPQPPSSSTPHQLVTSQSSVFQESIHYSTKKKKVPTATLR